MNPNNTTNPADTNTQSGTTTPFDQALTEKLMGASDIISSSQTGIQGAIEKAIAGKTEATKASTAAIESAGSREVAFAKQKAQQDIFSMEERGGGGKSMIAYRQMVEDTDKNIKDLEQRKQELILQNNAQGANAIAELQVQGLKFKQEAMQNTFSNLLGMAEYSTRVRAQTMAEKGQTYTEQANNAALALQYGVTYKEGDTLETIMGKIPPGTLTKTEAANLAKLASDIRLNNAQAAKAEQGTLKLDATNIQAVAHAAILNPSVLGSYADNPMLPQIIAGMEAEDRANATQAVNDALLQGISKQEALTNLDTLQLGTKMKLSDKYKLVDEIYAKQPSIQAVRGGGLPGLAKRTAINLAAGELQIANWIMGGSGAQTIEEKRKALTK